MDGSPDPATVSVAAPEGVAGSAPFRVDEPDKAWLVEAGSVDLFLVPTRPGQPPGARQHVVRTREGEALFGVWTPPQFPAMLLAVATPGSRVSQLPPAAVEGLWSEDAGIRLVETWIACLSAAVTQAVPPKSFELLDAGQPLGVKETVALLPREGLLWVKLREGSGRFAGTALPSPGQDVFFPLSSRAWIEAANDTQVFACRTRDVGRPDALWDGLQAFHAAVLDGLVRNLRASDEREAARVDRRRKSEQAQVDHAMRLLASPLEHEAAVPDLPEAGEDPWFLACAAVGRHAGIEFRPSPDKTLRRMDPVSAIARASGVRLRPVALKGRWWRQEGGALLGRREDDRMPVALLPDSRGGCQLYDPVARTRTGVSEEVAASLGPFAWQFYRPFPEKPLRAPDLVWFGLKGCGNDLTRLVLMGLGAALLGLVTPVVTGILFDSVIPGANRPQVGQIVALLLVVAVCTSLFQLTQGFAVLRLEAKMDASTQAAVWDRLLRLPVPFFRSYTSGDLAMRGLSISVMRQVLTGSVLSSFLSGIFSIVSFVLLFYYSPQLALLAVFITAVAVAVTIGLGWLQVRRQRELLAVSGRLSGLLLELINGIAKLRVSGTENRAFASWARSFARQKKLSVQSRTLGAALTVFYSVFPVLGSILIFYAMARLTEGQEVASLTTGEFLAFTTAFGQFQAAAIELSGAFLSVLGAVPLYERAKPILDALPEVSAAKMHPGELSGNIEVKHVDFRYRADTPLVLRDVSVKIPAGRFVAFVGPSGSGKSTLLRLLLGFETSESGSVYFDDQDLTGLDIQAVRQQIGVVLQNGRLAPGSIFENIVGSAPLTMEEAVQAARLAGLEDDIRAMPMGMHTMVAEGGVGLSGGQRQRLMIARAIVRRPRIIFFDEATSALDNETQSIVSRSLESLQATRVVIAHRLSTIINADYIYLMEKGAVVQEGRYEDLIHREGPFAELARRQIV